MTPAELIRRRELARDALLDSLLALREDKDEPAVLLALIAVTHLVAMSDMDKAITLWRAAVQEAHT